MSTEQNYAGGGNFATTPPPMAQNEAQTSQASDSRPSDYIDVNRQVYQAQTKLLELVDDYWQEAGLGTPVAVINQLLYHWLTTSTGDLARTVNCNQLHTLHALINFLTQLFESTTELDTLKKGGVKNEQ